MNREQAVNVLKEILDKCPSEIEGKAIILLPPKEDNSLSYTNQIHIQTRGDTVIQGCIADIANKHKLAMKLNGDWLIVYKPYPSRP